MTQKEKLIELIDKSYVPICDECVVFPADMRIEYLADFLLSHGVIVLDECKISRKNLPVISELGGRPLNDVLELIEAEKDKRLIRLPCKVGDAVYICPSWATEREDIVKSQIVRITIVDDHIWFCDNFQYFFGIDDFGITVFTTLEDAETAIGKERP